MDESGETLFSNATLAGDQDIRIGARDAPRKIDQAAHCRTKHAESRLVILWRRGSTFSLHLWNRVVMRDPKISKDNATRKGRNPSDLRAIIGSNVARDSIM